MARRTPLQGFDVSVTVVGVNGPELVGEFEEVEFSIKQETEEYLELGEKIAMILDGEIKLDGKLKRGAINIDIIKSCFGTGTLKRGQKIASIPRFTINFCVDASEKGMSGTYKFTDALIPEISFNASKGKGVVKNDYSFKAEGVEEIIK